MKVFVIQPNLYAESEVWLFRMNQMLEQNICGLAAFLQREQVKLNYPVYDLNGRRPDFWERQKIRFNLIKFDFNQKMRRELLKEISSSGANILIIHYATTAQYLKDLLDELTIPIFIYVHGFDIIWDHNDDNGERFHSITYSSDIYEISQKTNVTFIVSSYCSYGCLTSIGIPDYKIKKKIFGVDLPAVQRNYLKPDPQILFLGRFVDFKGPDIVLESFLKACDLGFRGTLVMAGAGPLKLMCELIAKRSRYADRISFLGAVTKQQAEQLYESSDIYSMHNTKGIISNGFDTFGVTIIEAMAYGLPVITSTIGGPAEIINNGVDGVLVQPNDFDEHANAFMQLFLDNQLREKLGTNGRKKVEIKYSSGIEKNELFHILGLSQHSK